MLCGEPQNTCSNSGSSSPTDGGYSSLPADEVFVDNNANSSQESIAEEHEEYQYLNLIRQILAKGKHKDDRTGVGTLSVFGSQLRCVT